MVYLPALSCDSGKGFGYGLWKSLECERTCKNSIEWFEVLPGEGFAAPSDPQENGTEVQRSGFAFGLSKIEALLDIRTSHALQGVSSLIRCCTALLQLFSVTQEISVASVPGHEQVRSQ